MITPTTPITVPNRLTRAGKTFKDFEDHAPQHLTYAGTLAKSSNIGTIRAAERLGNLKRLYPYLKKFGIGEPTGLGLPGEASGELLQAGRLVGDQRLHDDVRPGLLGQHGADGVGVRDDRQRRGARRAAAGRRHRPAPTARSARRRRPTHTRVVSAQTARTVRLMLETVTGDGGTAPLAAIPGYRVGGKTGTAQRFDPTCGCYRGYTMSFIGLAPADDPGVVVAVTLQAPKVGDRRRRQRRPGLQAGHVLRPGGAADPADRHQARPGSSSPRADR